ncbi:hypothetical protein [Mucilaginibacter aquaedulcis]|uniref:hypothetical protein n=1 Tax=Mucilaginibacter aquaedulcis TaxID=1187081 RepID=UPI0025B3F1D9|nr:hypothetical protein [Mucilaginibacter aquaedulcis]MDN3548769.1 hypothetical protein [Mucilaginibacter aquaedulcis]
MANIPPITDGFIDGIIKSIVPDSENNPKTTGSGLRLLIKLLRDRFEQGLTQYDFKVIQPDLTGRLLVSGGIENVVATTSILLDVGDKTPGRYGILIVHNQSPGQNQIQLADKNVGLTDMMNTSTGTIAKLAWYNLPDQTVWTSEIIMTTTGSTTPPSGGDNPSFTYIVPDADGNARIEDGI